MPLRSVCGTTISASLRHCALASLPERATAAQCPCAIALLRFRVMRHCATAPLGQCALRYAVPRHCAAAVLRSRAMRRRITAPPGDCLVVPCGTALQRSTSLRHLYILLRQCAPASLRPCASAPRFCAIAPSGSRRHCATVPWHDANALLRAACCVRALRNFRVMRRSLVVQSSHGIRNGVGSGVGRGCGSGSKRAEGCSSLEQVPPAGRGPGAHCATGRLLCARWHCCRLRISAPLRCRAMVLR